MLQPEVDCCSQRWTAAAEVDCCKGPTGPKGAQGALFALRDAVGRWALMASPEAPGWGALRFRCVYNFPWSAADDKKNKTIL